MTKTAILALLGLAMAAPAMGHPSNIPYASRGECESAYAKFSKLDRERLDQIPGVTPGDAQRTFRDIFRCEYDRDTQSWYIVQIGEFPG